jgi:hypothetical protein
MAGMFLVYLISPGSQFIRAELSPPRVGNIVPANGEMAIETNGNSFLQVVRTILVDMCKFDSDSALPPTKAAVARTPEKRFAHVLCFEILRA